MDCDLLVLIFYGTHLIQVENFPFDRQQCHMLFGSWTYTLEEINITKVFQDGKLFEGSGTKFENRGPISDFFILGKVLIRDISLTMGAGGLLNWAKFHPSFR